MRGVVIKGGVVMRGCGYEGDINRWMLLKGLNGA